MYNIYWFLDSVPTEDLGITKNGIKKSREDYYVIGGISGPLESIIKVYEDLNLRRNSQGRKFIRNPENRRLANKVLNDLIDSRKIYVLGTVFYHSQIPDVIRLNPHLYVSNDNPIERGINGMRGRSFAQTIWIIMEGVKKVPNLNPIVCLDNEDHIIQESVKYYFDRQLGREKPNAEVKVQSIDRARENEPKGYIVSDIICSILRNYIKKSPEEYRIFSELIRKTIKFDSKLKVVSSDGNEIKARFETRLVPQWTI